MHLVKNLFHKNPGDMTLRGSMFMTRSKRRVMNSFEFSKSLDFILLKLEQIIHQ